MRNFFTIIMTILTICVFAQNSPDPKDFFKSLKRPIWKFKADFLEEDCCFNGIYLYDNVLIVKFGAEEGCDDGKMYAINSNSGKILWLTDLLTYEGNYQFHSDNIIYSLENKLICLSIYSGKEKWVFNKMDCVLKDNSIYFKDSLIYILATNTNQPTLFHSESDLFATNDSFNNTGIILINIKNGKEIKSINNIIHKESWRIDYVNKNIIVLASNKAITAYDTKANQELWRFKKAHHPKCVGGGSISELQDTVIQYSFIYGMGDTVFFARKVSSINSQNGNETIIAVNLNTGDVISSFFAGEISRCIMNYDYVHKSVSNNNLYFIKRTNLSVENNCYGKADYTLTCIDMQQCKQKWEYNLSIDNKKFDVRKSYNNLFIDSTAIYFTYEETLICISPDKGQLLWEKNINNASISNVAVTKFFIICSIYGWEGKYNSYTLIIDKSNTSNTAHRNTEFFTYIIDNTSDVAYLVDNKKRLLKIKTK